VQQEQAARALRRRGGAGVEPTRDLASFVWAPLEASPSGVRLTWAALPFRYLPQIILSEKNGMDVESCGGV